MLRKQDAPSVQRLLSCALPAAASLLPPVRLLELAELCTSIQNTSASKQCFLLALQEAVRNNEPDWLLVSYVVRALVQMSVRDDEKLQQFKEAIGILDKFKEKLKIAPDHAAAPVQCEVATTITSRYPEQELRWLITNCWNRGAHHYRFARPAEAVAFMKTALRLLDHHEAMSSEHKAAMAKELQRALKSLGDVVTV